ncbi:hypothetical protein [Methanogenium organophilum]|uniref:Uncharacterized protein n=1 Tax=Methanogenium organophilum TaxID=2199 RepID=A0A9X9T764_METOG|nr:hypothetical protein [Methanogenium organophilum]WAI00400.1 hypothetical protein OU421_08145 [Methanogenium organophilum]
MKSFKKIVKLFYKTASRCLQNIQDMDYSSASKKANVKIKQCKMIITSDENASSEAKYVALIFGIYFRGIEELSEISSIVSSMDWITRPKDVQRVWFLLQNCIERFESVLPALNFPKDVRFFIEITLRDVSTQIETAYGKGMYVSPEVVIEECICSICNQDPRTCSHIENHVYNGKICRIVPTKIKPGFGGVVMTQNPKDKRCRMWPFDAKEDSDGKGLTVSNVPILISFRIDDFLD